MVANVAVWVIDPRGARLFVRLTPRSSRDAIDGIEALSDGRKVFKARVRAVPEDGKANEALRRLVARALNAPVSSVRVTGGATSRLKTLLIEGDPDDLARKLKTMESVLA